MIFFLCVYSHTHTPIWQEEAACRAGREVSPLQLLKRRNECNFKHVLLLLLLLPLLLLLLLLLLLPLPLFFAALHAVVLHGPRPKAKLQRAERRAKRSYEVIVTMMKLGGGKQVVRGKTIANPHCTSHPPDAAAVSVGQTNNQMAIRNLIKAMRM